MSVKTINGKLVFETTFAFDFDGTISQDEDGMIHLMNYLRNRGHNVIVVTGRREGTHDEDFDNVRSWGFPVYKTKYIAKRVYMREIEGIEVDVWIDDCPEAILENLEGTPKCNTFRDLNKETVDA